MNTVVHCESLNSESLKSELHSRFPTLPLNPDALDRGEKLFKRDDISKYFGNGNLNGNINPYNRILVTYDRGVYDITDYLSEHPGGASKILQAAGKDLGPFWRIYQQHFRTAVPMEILDRIKVGELEEGEEDLDTLEDSDPYDTDPDRTDALIFHNTKPCNAELPIEHQLDSWLTPNNMWFIRHHHPVPHLRTDSLKQKKGGQTQTQSSNNKSDKGIGGHIRDPDRWRLKIKDSTTSDPQSPLNRKNSTSTSQLEFTLDDLKTLFKPHKVVCTIQCGGNRRSGLDQVEKTSGIGWGSGAISTAEFEGVRLRDLLKTIFGDPKDIQNIADILLHQREVKHIVFNAADGLSASIPIESALDPFGDVLLAYKMNGQILPSEHGFPLRLVVPGHVGIRNVKWLTSISLSKEEAEGPWQRGIAYKGFSPNVKSFDGIDLEKIQSMQKVPVQSVITQPRDGPNQANTNNIHYDVNNHPYLRVKGWAYSGGGNGIVRVDVSPDNGKKTWITATLKEGSDQPPHRAFAWTFWEADIPLENLESESDHEIEICCKATDASYNVQPESPKPIWNARGLNNTSWHRVKVKVNLKQKKQKETQEESELEL